MPRTDSGQVQGVLKKDYDNENAPSLEGSIGIADTVLDRLVVYGSDNGIDVTDAEQTMLANLIAAHMYCISDRPYKSRSTGSGSGGFDGNTAMGWDATLYGQMAKRLDPTGFLQAQDDGGFLEGTADWLGQAGSTVTPWWQRHP